MIKLRMCQRDNNPNIEQTTDNGRRSFPHQTVLATQTLDTPNQTLFRNMQYVVSILEFIYTFQCVLQGSPVLYTPFK